MAGRATEPVTAVRPRIVDGQDIAQPALPRPHAGAQVHHPATFGLPLMSASALETVPDKQTQVVTLKTDNAALLEQVKKPLPSGDPVTHRAGRRTAHQDPCAPFELMSGRTPESMVRVGALPLRR
jgi:hypothetical protein